MIFEKKTRIQCEQSNKKFPFSEIKKSLLKLNKKITRIHRKRKLNGFHCPRGNSGKMKQKEKEVHHGLFRVFM